MKLKIDGKQVEVGFWGFYWKFFILSNIVSYALLLLGALIIDALGI